MKTVIWEPASGGGLWIVSRAVSLSGTPWSSKVAEIEDMSEPELEKKIQKKKCRDFFFGAKIFLFMTFFFEQKIFFEKIIFHEKIQKFSEKNREKIQKFYSPKWIFSREKIHFGE